MIPQLVPQSPPGVSYCILAADTAMIFLLARFPVDGSFGHIVVGLALRGRVPVNLLALCLWEYHHVSNCYPVLGGEVKHVYYS